jgi:hypothetical protein
VFHSPQSGQRPSHFEDAAPQDWQTKTEVGLGDIGLRESEIGKRKSEIGNQESRRIQESLVASRFPITVSGVPTPAGT